MGMMPYQAFTVLLRRPTYDTDFTNYS